MLLFGFCAINYSAIADIPKFSKQEALSDLDTLVKSIESVHPDLYSVVTKSRFDAELLKAKAIVKDSVNAIEFYRIVAPLVAQICDAHTSVRFPYNYFNKELHCKLFPFPVRVNAKDSSVIITDDYTKSENTIPKDAELLSVNGKPIKNWVAEMMAFVSAEKPNYKIENLKYLFTPLMFTLSKDTTFDIVYKMNGKMQEVKTEGISYSERYERAEKPKNVQNESFTFKILEDKDIALIEFNSFDQFDKFRFFLINAFEQIKTKNIRNLIIDIRKNSGGNSILGDEMFQYISPSAFRQFGKTTVKYSDIQKKFYKENYNSEIKEPNGIQVFDEDTTLMQLHSNNLKFNGNTYLLISNYTFSSAASFSWAFKYFKMGKVVGEESGGQAVSFGDIIYQQLPNTKLNFSISHKKFYQFGATDADDHGTLPDYEIEADKALDYTIELIKKSDK
jgi:hypothetical protein